MDSQNSSVSFGKKRKLSYLSSIQDSVKSDKAPRTSIEDTHIECHDAKANTAEYGVLFPSNTHLGVSTENSCDDQIEFAVEHGHQNTTEILGDKLCQDTDKTHVARMMDATPDEPNEDERAKYYYGLPSAPRLIARTSSTPWVPPGRAEWDRNMHPKKQFRAIGQHHILERWSEVVKSSLILTLDGYDWRCFYPIRLGYTEKPTNDEQLKLGVREHYPVVLLVGLAESALHWEHAIKLALACRDVLCEAGIVDVEVELLEADITRFGSSRVDLERLIVKHYWVDSSTTFPSAAINKSMIPVLPHLGYHIVQAPSGKGGTMGLHLRLGSDNSKTYGLVSRHVAVGDRLGHDADVKSTDQKKGCLKIAYPLTAVDAALESIGTAREHIMRPIRPPLQRKVDEHRATEDDMAKLREVDTLLQYADDLTCALKTVQKVSPEEVSVEQRTLGRVIFSPKHEVHARHGFFRDWALVELDASQFQHAPENKVYIGKSYPPTMPFASLPAIEAELSDLLDGQDFLQIRGIRPWQRQTHTRQAFHVGKYGMTTGLTFGIVGEIEAILREPIVGMGEIISWALLIVSANRRYKYPGDPFSEPGDSGSCIFDLFGRAVGILDSGQTSHLTRRYGKAHTAQDPELPPSGAPTAAAPAGCTDFDESFDFPRETQQREVDITFATPMQWLLEDIEAFTGEKVEII